MSSEILMAGDTGSMDLTDDRTRNSITDPPMVVIDNESSKDATIIQGIEQKEIIQSMNKGKGIMGLDDNLVETTEERFAWSRSESLMDKHADPIANCYQQVNYKVDEGLITGDEQEKYQSMEIEEQQVSRSSSCREVDEEEDVPLSGFRFHPTDEELVGFYLRRKVEKKPISIELIKQIDIYKYDPWDLPKSSNVGDKEWYFFCRRGRKYRNSIRPNRVTGSGFWKATGIDRPIYSATAPGSVCIGLKKSLVYYRGSAGKGTKTDWRMHEFHLPPNSSEHNVVKHMDDKFLAQEAEVWTLCKILKRNVCHRKTLLEWREVSGKRNLVVDASSKTCSGDNSDHDIPIREALCCLSDQGKHSNRRRSSQRFTGHNKKKDQSNHEDVHDIRINIDDAVEFATTADWHDQIIEEDGKRRIVFRYKLPDSKTKVCEIILGIAGQAAAGFATNVLASKSNSSHPQVYTVVGATAVAFVGTLTSLSLGKKSPKWAGIFGKVGAAAAVLGTMVGLGMYLPDHQVLISGIVATIPVLVVAFA